VSAVREVHARQILDSRGIPTVEVEVGLRSGAQGRAAAPAGASTGRFEARELRDGGARWHGQGVCRAVESVNCEIADALRGGDAGDLAAVDGLLERLDGTSGMSRLGANAILAVSLAVARAVAAEAGRPLWRLLAGDDGPALPVPMFTLLDGGRHADNRVPIQELMVVPAGVSSFSAALRLGSETRQALRDTLKERGMSTAVGDEGGFSPALSSAREGLELLLAALKRAGYEAGRHAWLALDCAATELLDSGGYLLYGDEPVPTDEAIAYWCDLCHRYPILALEDPLAEEDWEGWRRLLLQLGDTVHLVGDDLFATHAHRLAEGIRLQLATAVVVKPNQAGTLTRALAVTKMAQANRVVPVFAARSGDTEDTAVAELAAATRAVGLKAGAPCRSERVAKYNELARIEEALGADARYLGRELLHPWPGSLAALSASLR
jgi:enolase